MKNKIFYLISILVIMFFPLNNVFAETNFEIVGLTTQTGTPTPTDPVNILGRTGEIQETIDNQEYTFNLGNIILDSIGSYTDKIYKNNGTWYLQKNTKRIILNGSENWTYSSSRKTFSVLLDNVPVLGIEEYPTMYSNKLVYGGITLWRDQTATTYEYGFLINNGNLHIRNKNYNTKTDFQLWLSNNNIEVLVPLAISEESVIEDTILLEQLNNVSQEVIPTPTPQEDTQLIYIPKYYHNNCVEILDKDTIRVFDSSDSMSYIDYFTNNHYISKTGSVDSSYVKKCSTLEFTTDYKYRNDLPEILIITLCLIALTILPCYMLWKIFYKRS